MDGTLPIPKRARRHSSESPSLFTDTSFATFSKDWHHTRRFSQPHSRPPNIYKPEGDQWRRRFHEECFDRIQRDRQHILDARRKINEPMETDADEAEEAREEIEDRERQRIHQTVQEEWEYYQAKHPPYQAQAMDPERQGPIPMTIQGPRSGNGDIPQIDINGEQYYPSPVLSSSQPSPMTPTIANAYPGPDESFLQHVTSDIHARLFPLHHTSTPSLMQWRETEQDNEVDI